MTLDRRSRIRSKSAKRGSSFTAARPGACPSFGPDARHGWHRPSPSRCVVDYPRWWDDDPTDSPSQEDALIRRSLAARDPHAVEQERRDMDAWITEHTAPEQESA